MKLLSLWIENYKNICNQGFNFGSPYFFRYSLSTDKYSQEKKLAISVSRNVNYINLFNENVKNISGIIGKNGSGKTSLLNLIKLLQSNFALTNHVVVVYERSLDKKIVISKFGKVNLMNQISFRINYEDNEIKYAFAPELQETIIDLPIFDEQPNYNLIFYSNALSDHNDKVISNIINCSVDFRLRECFHEKRLKEYINQKDGEGDSVFAKEATFDIFKIYFQERLSKFFNLIVELKKNEELSALILKDIKLPDYLSININYEFIKPLLNLKVVDDSKLNLIITYTVNLLNSESDRKEKFKNELIIKTFLYSLYLDLFQQTDPITSTKELQQFVTSIPLDNLIFDNLRDYLLSKRNTSAFFKVSRLNKLIQDLPQLLDNIDFYKSRTWADDISYNFEINESLWPLLSRIFDIQYDQLEGILKFRWHGLSAGEEALLNQFAEFFYIKDKIITEHILIIIDEGELYLHPDWQSKYLNLLSKFFQLIFREKNIQIILTSHSPFIISDLPNYNLIFMKKEDGCGIVTDISEQNLTFGGNLIDLFSNSFFIDKAVSDFALERINDAINFLNGEESFFTSVEEVEKFSSIIGETIIREQLNKMIERKKYSDFQNKIKRIE